MFLIIEFNIKLIKFKTAVLYLINQIKLMKKTILFFALTLAAVGAAFSQNDQDENTKKKSNVSGPVNRTSQTTDANSEKEKSGNAETSDNNVNVIKFSDFVQNIDKYENQSVTLSDVTFTYEAQCNKGNCAVSPNQTKVCVFPQNAKSNTGNNDSYHGICFKSDKKIFGNNKWISALSVTVVGNKKDGYTISNPKFRTIPK